MYHPKRQCSLGWFYGFKLRLIINDSGKMLDFILTPGNVGDREPLKCMGLHRRIFGKLFGDKDYIGKDLFEQLFIDGVHLISKLRKNMKNALMLLHDRIILRKRVLIESINNELKNICQIEYSHHRRIYNLIISLLSRLTEYSFFDEKPSINIKSDIVDQNNVVVV